MGTLTWYHRNYEPAFTWPIGQAMKINPSAKWQDIPI